LGRESSEDQSAVYLAIEAKLRASARHPTIVCTSNCVEFMIRPLNHKMLEFVPLPPFGAKVTGVDLAALSEMDLAALKGKETDLCSLALFQSVASPAAIRDSGCTCTHTHTHAHTHHHPHHHHHHHI
jgi:hypothetical protein